MHRLTDLPYRAGELEETALVDQQGYVVFRPQGHAPAVRMKELLAILRKTADAASDHARDVTVREIAAPR